MTQTPSKTVASKKTAAIPKSASTTKKTTTAKTTAAKTAVKKVATPKAALKDASKPAVKKTSTRVTTSSTKGNGEAVKRKTAKNTANTGIAVTPEQRYRMICDAAYFRAEQRGFIGGHPEQDWHEAELEIDQRLCDLQEEQQNH